MEKQFKEWLKKVTGKEVGSYRNSIYVTPQEIWDHLESVRREERERTKEESRPRWEALLKTHDFGGEHEEIHDEAVKDTVCAIFGHEWGEPYENRHIGNLPPYGRQCSVCEEIEWLNSLTTDKQEEA